MPTMATTTTNGYDDDGDNAKGRQSRHIQSDEDDDDDDYDDNPQRISTEQQRPINNKPFQGGVGVGVGVGVRVGGNYPNTTSKPSPSLFYPLSFTLLSDSFWLSGL